MPSAFHAAPLAGLALRCQPDDRLVTLCREGHGRAFEEIVRRYRPQLVSFAAAIVPSHRAEDVVQEALTKAHSSLVASGGEMKLRPWLYTIVRNRALNDLRDEPGHERLDEDFDGVPQPPDVAAQRSELAAIIAGVRSLPAAQREALLRRELEGRSHHEIAAAIGVTPGAVRGLIFRARTALRESAGMMIPLPVLRGVLNAGPLTTEATGAGVGGAAALTAGGGGGMAIKTGAALLVAGLAVGSGVAFHDHGDRREATAATVARSDASGGTRSQAGHRDGSGQDGGSQAGNSERGSRSPDNSNGDGEGSGSTSRGPGPSGSEGGSTGGREGGDDGGHHGGAADDGTGDQPGDGGHDGSDDPVPVSGGTGGEHEGGGGTSGGGATGTGDGGDTGSTSDDGGTTSGDSGESTGSHDGAGQLTADSEAPAG